MAYDVAKLILLVAVLLLPFQLLGVGAYFVLRKNDQQRANTAVVLVPAGTFAVTFLAMFLWSYFHPGMMFMVSGAINLFILILLVSGTFLNLAVGAIVRSILQRRKASGGGVYGI